MLANVPRIDYTGGGCGKLLLEPQRTNLVLYSEQFDNAAWTKSGTTISANVATSPAGFTDADLITLNAGTSVKQVFQSFSAVTGTFSYSIFAKAGTHRFVQLLAGTSAICNFNLELGTFNATASTGSIQNYGNGWFRCNMVATYTSNTAINLLAVDSLTSVRAQATSSTGTFIIYGAQLEEGSFATSYIPTVAAAVTRNADEVSKTGISSLIGQTEGTLFVEVNVTTLQGAATRVIFSIQTGTTFVRLLFSAVGSNTLRALVRDLSVDKFDARTTISTTGIIKLAIAYKSLDSSFYVNGVQITNVLTDLSFGSLTMGDVTLGYDGSTNELGDSISQALLFPTRLTNSELETLTTL
jgi:hypothetical protein